MGMQLDVIVALNQLVCQGQNVPLGSRQVMGDADTTVSQGVGVLALTATQTAARTITLPAGVPAGTVLKIKDEKGQAFNVNNLKIKTPTTGMKFDGTDVSSSAGNLFTTATTYQSASLYFNGTDWFTGG